MDKNSRVYLSGPIDDHPGWVPEEKWRGSGYYKARARKIQNIYISEYTMPNDFIPIAQIEKMQSCAINNSARAIEKIWTNQQTFEILSDSRKAIMSNEFAEQLTFEF